MYTTSIQRLSFILLIFANTRIYATSIATIHNRRYNENGKMIAKQIQQILNAPTSYERKIEREKVELRQHLLEKNGYNDIDREYSSLRKQTQRIYRIKKIYGEINKKEQEILDRGITLREELRKIKEKVDKEVDKEVADRYLRVKKKSKIELEKDRRKERKELGENRIKELEEDRGEFEADMERIGSDHKIWMRNYEEKLRKERVREKKLRREERVARKEEENEFYENTSRSLLQQGQLQELSNNNFNSDSKTNGGVVEHFKRNAVTYFGAGVLTVMTGAGICALVANAPAVVAGLSFLGAGAGAVCSSVGSYSVRNKKSKPKSRKKRKGR